MKSSGHAFLGMPRSFKMLQLQTLCCTKALHQLCFNGKICDDELKIYKRIAQGSKKHPGYKAVRSLLDSFDVDGPDGRHRCLVHPPLWESLLALLHRNPILRLPAPVLAFALQRVFLALDFLHNECQIVHTGIWYMYILNRAC